MNHLHGITTVITLAIVLSALMVSLAIAISGRYTLDGYRNTAYLVDTWTGATSYCVRPADENKLSCVAAVWPGK